MSTVDERKRIRACAPLLGEPAVQVVAKLVDELDEVHRSRDAWENTAEQESRNVGYYRGVVDRVAALLGPEVFLQDDGGVSTEPLRAKVPELVGKLVAERDRFLADADTMREALADQFGEKLPSGDPVACIRAFGEGFREYEKRTVDAEATLARQGEELRRLAGVEEDFDKANKSLLRMGKDLDLFRAEVRRLKDELVKDGR